AHRADVEPELREPRIKVRALDLETLEHRRDIPSGRPKKPLEVSAFELSFEIRERAILDASAREERRRFPRTDHATDMRRGDRLSRRGLEHEPARDRLELAHVSGPVVQRKLLHRLPVDAGKRALEATCRLRDEHLDELRKI